MYEYEKFTKDFEIGEYKFTLGINRKIAKDLILKSPSFTVKQLEIEEYQSKHQSADGKPTKEDIIFYALKKEETEEAANNIAAIALGKLLSYGHEGKNKPNFFEVDYEVTALKLIDYCKDNNVWNDYYDQENGEHIYGIAMLVALFISEGFTKGERTPTKKPTMTIKIQ